jgi:hypothetical protein
LGLGLIVTRATGAFSGVSNQIIVLRPEFSIVLALANTVHPSSCGM